MSARALAASGATVVLAARDQECLASVAQEIERTCRHAAAVPTDVTNAASVERLVERTLDDHGHLDAALNNAAGSGHLPTSMADTSVEDFDSSYAVNLRGVFLSMKYEIPVMLASGGGAIVNMASTAGVEAVGGLAGYASSKHGLIGLTKVAALDYADRGIRVNAPAAGPILTDRLEQAGKEVQRPAGLAMPTGRVGRPDEDAAAVVWLLSDRASFVTGVTLPIDGGKLAGAAPSPDRELPHLPEIRLTLLDPP